MSTSVFHDGADGAFGDPVEGVHVGRASGLSYQFRINEVLELFREKFSRVVSVEGADDFDRLGSASIEVLGVERGDEGSDLLDCLALGFEDQVDELVPGVIIHEHESVTVSADGAHFERADDVCVDETSGVRWLVDVGRRMSLPFGVGLDAVRAGCPVSRSYSAWDISGERGKARDDVGR